MVLPSERGKSGESPIDAAVGRIEPGKPGVWTPSVDRSAPARRLAGQSKADSPTDVRHGDGGNLPQAKDESA